jgi:hypothetical protein
VRDAGRVHSLVQTAVSSYGFVGIKVHRHEGRITREICEAARGFSLPVLYDVMGEVSACELLAREYADVNFIIPHLGSFAGDWRAHLALIDQLARHPNMHADTSGVQRFDLLAEAVQRAGARKVLFGSDGPWLHPGVELAKVRAVCDELRLGQSDEARMLAGNFLRLIARVRVRSRTAPRLVASAAVEVDGGALSAELADPWARPSGGQAPALGSCCG